MKVVVEEKVLNGIAVNEYYNPDVKQKNVIFIQHGFTSTRHRGADNLGCDLARRGYLVVAIDAYKHGDRIEEPFISQADEVKALEMFDTVIEKTAEDIVQIFNDFYQKDFSKMSLIGISMGGMIVYHVATIFDKIDVLIPMITTPNIYQYAQDAATDKIRKMLPNEEAFFSHLEKINPSSKFDMFVDLDIFAFNGVEDKLIPYVYEDRFIKKLQEQSDKAHINLYKCGHKITKEMQEDLYEYLKNIHQK